jgi:DNA-binding Xre family transcriptional regulator
MCYTYSVMVTVNIDNRLRELGKSAYWLANEIGCSHGYISKIRRGQLQGIGFEMLDKLCAALMCEPSDLIKRTSPVRVINSLSSGNRKVA